MTHLTCAYPWVLPWTCGITLVAAVYVLWLKKKVRYRYALSSFISLSQGACRVPVRHILFALRAILLLLLAFLVARPQWLDVNRESQVKGIDIVLALDASGSMELFDDLKDRTPRIEAAKREAIDFIKKRTNDPIGIVFFAAQAISKIPLTLDKSLLHATVQDFTLGDLDPNGTMLFTGLATAINRLRSSTARSKIIVLLTDGIPSPDDPVDAATVLSAAREFGIKMYTLGVGRADVAYGYGHFGRVEQYESKIDMALLEKIARETGGKSYRACTPADLKKAYDSIDKLERTEIKTNLFQNYHEAFEWFLLLALLALVGELVLRMLVWRGLV